MATYRIEGKNGEVYRVEGPDDADPSQIIASITGQPAAAPAAAPPPVGEALGGVPSLEKNDTAMSFADAPQAPGFDLKQLLGDAVSSVHGVTGPLAQSLSTGVAGSVPGLQEFLTSMGMGASFRPEGEEPGMVGSAVEGAGAAAGMLAGGAASLGARAAARPAAFATERVAELAGKTGIPATVRRLGDQFLDTLKRHPKSVIAAEGAAGAGAGVGAETARQVGEHGEGDFAEAAGSETGQTLGGILGGVVAATPVGLMRAGRNLGAKAADKVLGLVNPELRAARQLQSRAADPKQAAERALAAPEGITPARASQEPALMATERKVLDTEPARAAAVEKGTEVARERSIQELADSFGPGSKPGEWEHSVMERVAAPGAKVKPADTDQMLDEAYRSYDSAYDAARDAPVVLTEGANVPLLKKFDASVGDHDILAGDAERAPISGWLRGQVESLQKRAQNGLVDSGDLLELRSKIRAQLRRRQKAGRTNETAAAQADMLRNAERDVTEALESALPDDVAEALRATDARYRELSQVQQAVFAGGDKELTAAALHRALRQGAKSPSKMARGKEPMTQVARRGTPIEKVLKTPADAKRFVRGMKPEELQRAKSDATQYLVSKASVAGADGTGTVSGKQLTQLLKSNDASLRALGFTPADIGRASKIAETFRLTEAKSPAAVEQILTDTPGTILRLVATLIGAKSGDRLAKRFGSSLVMAQFGSSMARERLKGLTKDKAEMLIREAMTDKELFAALLTRPTDPVKKQNVAARTLGTWLGVAATSAEEPDDED